MQIQAGDIKKFPKFAAYVSVKLPEVAKVDVIISTIQKLSGTIDKKTIKEALFWGKGPAIKIVPGLTCAGVSSVGCFSFGTHSHEIRIKEERVKEFEAGKGLRKTAKGQMVYLVGVGLLHELTHWADDQDGTDDPPVEEGDEFEKAIYGAVVH